jgi:hypothetical protein
LEDDTMRKPRDFDAELKALDERAKQLRERRLAQFGELVIATGADALDVETLAGALLAAAESKDSARRRHGVGAARRSFSGQLAARRAELAAASAAARRLKAARSRLALSRARHDNRDWVVKRRERTRQLIELGGLIVKAGLVELTDDDRAVIFGLLDAGAATLRGEGRGRALESWGRRGRRAFGTDAALRDGATS